MAVQLLPLTLATPPRRPPREDQPRSPEEMPQSEPDLPDDGAPDLPDPLPVERPDPAPSETPPTEVGSRAADFASGRGSARSVLSFGKPFQLVEKACETA
jgi:hypothetical protein